MGLLVVMAILVIYMVLGILYESFIHPITILSGLPSAGMGALATLLLFHDELNIYSFVGIIMLVGIVKKNAIMMIDFAIEAQRLHNVPAADAIYEACLVRFRPIMMTTMAALMGTLPIAMGLGAGSEARRPLGLAVVGGTGGFAAPDALHHSGGLHLHGRVPRQVRQAWRQVWPQAEETGRSRSRPGRCRQQLTTARLNCSLRLQKVPNYFLSNLRRLLRETP